MELLTHISFDNLVEDYRQKLLSAAFHLCRDRDAAHDIVQETLVAAYRAFDSLKNPESVGAWLFTILRRQAISYHHGKKPEVELMDSTAQCPEDADALVRMIVREQMGRLSDDDREILAGKYLLGLSYQELAEALGVKEGAIRVRCFRAKERMREMLQGAGIRGESSGV